MKIENKKPNPKITYKLVIDGKLPNLNDYTRANRTVNRGYSLGSKMKKETEEIISFYIMRDLKGIHFDKKVKIDFKWYEENKKRDIDNVAFGKKFILDALVRNGIIQTDGWRGVAGFTDSFFIDKNNPRIEVLIEKVEE